MYGKDKPSGIPKFADKIQGQVTLDEVGTGIMDNGIRHLNALDWLLE